MKFDFFVGIDQTGATDNRGGPKALDVSIISLKPQITYKTGLKLKKLSLKSVKDLISQHWPFFSLHKVLILIDSVFALPAELGTSHLKVLNAAKNFQFNNKLYGAETAFYFFNQYQKSKPVHFRNIDLILNAQSVFQLKPYQRNIGCGSYRILKDLASEKKWYSVWPFEKLNRQFVIAEGYPSFYWSKLLQSPKRNLPFLVSKYPDLKITNLNQADSFILALAAKKFQNQIDKPILNSKAKSEGWVLGVPTN